MNELAAEGDLGLKQEVELDKLIEVAWIVIPALASHVKHTALICPTQALQAFAMIIRLWENAFNREDWLFMLIWEEILELNRYQNLMGLIFAADPVLTATLICRPLIKSGDLNMNAEYLILS